jgi:hypothetical protein
VVKHSKRLERRLTSAIKKHPGYLFLLVTLIGHRWLPPGFDFFEFYSYCMLNNKIKPAKKGKFTKIIEFGIKTKLAQCFSGWRSQISLVKAFKKRWEY